MGREGGTRQATRQATYVDLVSEREAPEGAGTGVWFIGGERDVPNLDPVRREERPHIVEVARSVGAGAWTVTEKEGKDGDRRKPRRSKFSDLCILFPNRTSLDDLERSLEEAGVPYTVEGQMLAYNTQDVRDLVNCLAAIDDPSDEVAIVAALRSPAFGCSDVDLYDWTRAGGKFSYLAKRGPANGPVGSALAVLRRYHEDRLGHTAAHVVERFIREMRVRELALDGGRARERWRLLGVVIEQARVLAEAGRWSLRDLVRWCEERRERQERTADGGVAELDVNAVRLMTVHYAKGLEFPIVLLTGLSGRRAGDRGPVRFDRSGDLARERMLAVRTAGFGYGDYDDLAEREKAAADEESVRLVYVAATRARDHLIVSLYRRTGDKASLASQLVGHVGEDSPLWRRLELEHPAVRTDGAEATPRATEAVDTEAGREAWLAARAEVVAKASLPYSVAATALAARGAPSPTGPAVAVPGPAGIPAPTAGGPAGSPARIAVGAADGGRAGSGAVTPQEDEPWRRGRGGTLVGRAVHAALQDIDLRTGDALVEICQRHALAEGIRDPEVVADVTRLVKAVVALDVVRGAAEGRHWKEVYVTVPLPTLGGGVLEGFVDLVYVEPSGELGIVDYKTDTVGERGSLERAARPYRLQLGAYAHAVEAATGRRVGAAWIVFARRAAEGKPAAYRITDLEAAKRRAAVAAFDMVSGS
ncbi:PD-(D/E)XK nuclease family protein [bacterium]|nr:PD-(D/E)XK nuclease family protein [bacterium]